MRGDCKKVGNDSRGRRAGAVNMDFIREHDERD
jgi:hypothetical protein